MNQKGKTGQNVQHFDRLSASSRVETLLIQLAIANRCDLKIRTQTLLIVPQSDVDVQLKVRMLKMY